MDTAVLLVSEFVTNVVLHAGTTCELRLRRGDRLRVEVVDGSKRAAAQGRIGSEGNSGRGLLLVKALSTDCGTIVEPDGKLVWFEMDWVPAPPA